VFPWDPDADGHDPGGPTFVPRAFQGQGRHDAPELYGALYMSSEPLSGLCEQLSRFRGRAFRPEMLVRRGLRLAVCRYALDDAAPLVDLDEPLVLRAQGLRPSLVATRRRESTQAQARLLFEANPAALGLRWWSLIESTWINLTVFADRAGERLRAARPRELEPDEPLVREAIEVLGLGPA
jgi:hypothetical protein